MTRQVVSYDDLDTPVVAPIINPPDISAPAAATLVTTSSAADTTGRGIIGTAGNANTAHLTSKDVDAIPAPEQNGISISNNISSVDSSPPKKRKRDDIQLQTQSQVGNISSGSKKRKSRGRQGNKNQGKSVNGMGSGNGSAGIPSQSIQHWDDPGAEVDGLAYDDGEAMGVETIKGVANGGDEGYDKEQAVEAEDWEVEVDVDENEEDESRELTHDEIWDDSALVAAWDAANEEYEALHGKTKHWKKGRVHKSPLWYNIPPEPQNKSKGKQKATSAPGVDYGSVNQISLTHQRPMDRGYGDSTPLDFNTYVPTHDASLSSAVGADSSNITAHHAPTSFRSGASANTTLYPPSRANAQTLSQVNMDGVHQMSADAAFSRALDAMYWCGYWTAVYHTQRSKEHGAEGTDDAHGDEEDEAEEEIELLVSTQR